MAKHALQALSEAQQEIMEIIWDHGELSVSEVWEILQERRDIARNTVQTMVVRIEQKGWIEHRSIGRTFVYKAIQPRTTTLRQRLDDLMSAAGRGISGGSGHGSVGRRQSVTKDAADRIRAMIDEAEQRTKTRRRRGSDDALRPKPLRWSTRRCSSWCECFDPGDAGHCARSVVGSLAAASAASAAFRPVGRADVCLLLPCSHTTCADRIDVPLISIAWPSSPVSHPHRTVARSHVLTRRSTKSRYQKKLQRRGAGHSRRCVHSRRTLPDVIERDSENAGRCLVARTLSDGHCPSRFSLNRIESPCASNTCRSLTKRRAIVPSDREITYGLVWTDVANVCRADLACRNCGDRDSLVVSLAVFEPPSIERVVLSTNRVCPNLGR